MQVRSSFSDQLTLYTAAACIDMVKTSWAYESVSKREKGLLSYGISGVLFAKVVRIFYNISTLFVRSTIKGGNLIGAEKNNRDARFELFFSSWHCRKFFMNRAIAIHPLLLLYSRLWSSGNYTAWQVILFIDQFKFANHQTLQSHRRIKTTSSLIFILL